MWKAIKENWGQITLLGGILTVLVGGYVEWRIQMNVQDIVGTSGFVKQSTVDANTKALDRLEKTHEKDADKLDEKVEKIIAILIE